jgi:acetolactate synthase-1/3 small subunit
MPRNRHSGKADMQTKVFQLLVDNTSGVLSRIAGLFSRRGYNIDSITAGVTANPGITRITIVTHGDDDIMEQIEKQVRKLIDVRDIHELKPSESVYRELAMIKVKCSDEQRQGVIAITNIFRASIIDVSPESLMIEITGSQDKIEAFLGLLKGYEILEIARTGVAGLGRGIRNVLDIDHNGKIVPLFDKEGHQVKL